MKILDYISPQAIEKIRQEIQLARENEVFFVGKTNENLIIEKVTVVARGNELSVPLVKEHASRCDVVIHNHPSGFLSPSQNDIAIAHDLSNFGVASYIVNNEVDDIYVVVEPFSKHDKVQIDVEKIVKTLSPGGAVSEKLKGYEHRPQQLEMISRVAHAFNDQKIAVVEAGTGVGKSLAYLIPAIYWATQNNERCVVSTNTINLQEQLVKKDIPFLKKALGINFNSVLVKGRGNYICLRKLQGFITGQETLFEDEYKEEMKLIINWVKITKDGSKADLNFIPNSTVWENVCSESDSCLHSKCEFFKECFITKARRSAVQAQILVVNHHLLFSDLAVRAIGVEVAVLPKYHHIIFDEAHNIEDIATDYFGSGITRTGIARIIRRMHNQAGDKRIGYLNTLVRQLKIETKQYRIKEFDEIITQVENELIPRCDAIIQFSDDVMAQVSEIILAYDKGYQNEVAIRINERIRKEPQWKNAIIPQIKNFIQLLSRFNFGLSLIIEKVETVNIKLKKEILYTLVDLHTQRNRIKAIIDVIEQIILKNDQANVRWIEVQKRTTTKPIVRLKIAPLDITERMNEFVYENFKTIIMTSATMTISGQRGFGEFGYLIKQVGLNLVEKARLITAKIPASFDYKKQVIVGIPIDVPAPDSTQFSLKLPDAIFEALEISGGRAFVLFTSYGLLNKVFNELQPRLLKMGIVSLKQGQQNRHQLLEEFKRDKTSVLFGTDSFWQGVDVEGDALESVIITKLPFKVPSEPIVEARVEAIERRGGNAFMEYSVPQAVIKFKQGFGRLIRKKTDRGSVFVFDKRIIEKFYGKIFIQSLPEVNVTTGPLNLVLEKVKTFFNDHP